MQVHANRCECCLCIIAAARKLQLHSGSEQGPKAHALGVLSNTAVQLLQSALIYTLKPSTCSITMCIEH